MAGFNRNPGGSIGNAFSKPPDLMAKRIVKRFKEATLDVIEVDIARLAEP
jgi:hypothetical protein